MTADLWQRGCERLAAELPEQQFNTWIRPLPAADVTDHGEAATVVSVRVPNRFKLDWIRNQYAGRIEAVLSELAGQPVRLDLTLAQREPPPPPVGLPARNGSDGLPHQSLDPFAAIGGARASAVRDGHGAAAPPTQRQPDLRHPGAGPRQPDGAHRGAARRRRARASCTTRCSSTAASAWARPT